MLLPYLLYEASKNRDTEQTNEPPQQELSPIQQRILAYRQNKDMDGQQLTKEAEQKPELER